VSTDYYTKLERGKIRHVSDSVLDAIARALQLDDVEHAHLHALFRPAPRAAAAPPTPEAETGAVQRILDGMVSPALAYDSRQNIAAANLAGRAVFAPLFDRENPNLARFTFLDSRARDFYADWPLACSLTAAMLRYEAGRNPLNAEMTALIGELSARSPQFRVNWAEQDVHEHRSGDKLFRHPEAGDLRLTYDVLELPGTPGLSLTVYTATDPATTKRLRLLTSWAADSLERDERDRGDHQGPDLADHASLSWPSSSTAS